MNPVLQMFLNALIKYISEHPDQVEILVKALIDKIVYEIKKNQ